MLSFAGTLPSGLRGSGPKSSGESLLINEQARPLIGDATAAVAAGDWLIVTSPNGGTRSNVLRAVTCASASDCWAVGNYYTGTAFQTLIERWDGTSWVIVTSPNTSTAQENVLTGVTCVSAAADCWAVGHYYNTDSIPQTLVEHWNGTSWAIVTSPNTSAAQNNFLNDVTCTSASDCWTAGYNHTVVGTETISQTLIEHWNGSFWAIVPSANASVIQNNALNGVTCTSASDCWAVGVSDFSGIAGQTLIERWDGTSWALVTSPTIIGARNNFLNDVTCASASNCWAVGAALTSSNSYQTLTERWDGTSWTLATSPNTSTTQNNFLYGVTCMSASNCWAVGYDYTAGNADQTLIEHWDGTAWVIVTSPTTSATQNNVLYRVACAAESDCWTVGYHVNASGVAQTLIEHYTVSPPVPTSAVSRKTHGLAGVFDIDLPLAGKPGIECRTGGTNSDYQILLTFANAVTFNSASITSGTGSVTGTSGSGTTAITVNLTGVSNAQTITVTLSGVNDGTNTGDVGVRMSVLTGDTTADGFVNSGDIAQTKSQSGSAVTIATFREDVTTDGNLNSGDIALVKSKSGTALP